MAIGAATAINKANINKNILLTTASFSRESLQLIKDGKISLNVDESPITQGRAAINAIIHALNGNTIPVRIVVDSPSYDLENVEDVDVTLQWAPLEFQAK
jgi:ABC-type sugar transport system substrate-binding protein